LSSARGVLTQQKIKQKHNMRRINYSLAPR
jgi:hypothetical protein